MVTEILLLLASGLVFRFFTAPSRRRVVPARYTVRFLLLVITAAAILLGLSMSWARR